MLNDRDVQLGFIEMFMALFATSFAVLTNAWRAEVFASTAAYAAVLVVFSHRQLGLQVGGTLQLSLLGCYEVAFHRVLGYDPLSALSE